jgi:putative FmdB family regulatory protein
MPLYEYQCEPCDRIFETLIRGSSDVARCPGCGSIEVAKLLSVPAAAHTGQGRASELAVCNELGGGRSFGCGRPQCGSGTCAGLG